MSYTGQSLIPPDSPQTPVYTYQFYPPNYMQQYPQHSYVVPYQSTTYTQTNPQFQIDPPFEQDPQVQTIIHYEDSLYENPEYDPYQSDYYQNNYSHNYVRHDDYDCCTIL